MAHAIETQEEAPLAPGVMLWNTIGRKRREDGIEKDKFPR
jgi:hypothetical protein